MRHTYVLNDSKVGSTRLILRTLKLEYTDVKWAGPQWCRAIYRYRGNRTHTCM